ncbi:MAG TPA: SRPBCC family protein [Gemmatimonadaceae bacterium]|nr:SRPBCC family protein [Gemmatimonadaceae bacterium]
MFVPVLAVLAGGVAALVAYASSRPAEFRVQRRGRIAAPPRDIVPHLDDFRAWAAWSPWEKLDPAMQRTYGGPARGVGATYAWDGNKKAGAGRMEITRSDDRGVAMTLDFTRPMRATNITEFALTPDNGGTEVVWTMNGSNNLMGKLFGVFVNMDQLVGRDFEKGLASLKAVSEGSSSSAGAAS